MQLVLFGFKIIEELPHRVDNVCPLLWREISKWDIQPHVRTSLALELIQIDPVSRFGPGFDDAVDNGFCLVRHHQIQVQIDGISETLAARAGAERTVKRE